MKNLLSLYEGASSQKLNLLKFEALLCNTTGQQDRRQILGIREGLPSGSKYLGLPSLIGRNKKADFNYIKDRLWKKLNSWRGRVLSGARREIMLKSVAQVVPNYGMSIYLFLESWVDSLQKNDEFFFVGARKGTVRLFIGCREINWLWLKSRGGWASEIPMGLILLSEENKIGTF